MFSELHEREVQAMKQSPLSLVAALPARAGRWAYSMATAATAAALVAVVTLVGCGGGGSTPVTGVEVQKVRPLSADFTTRKAVNYSPFRTFNRDTEVITKTMIKQDMDLLLAGGFKLIRLFDSSDMVAKQTLEVIRDNSLDIKVYLGAYLAGYGNSKSSANDAEVARTIALANQFSAIVVAVSVGNEMLVFDFNKIDNPATLAGYITKVRNGINQPVTTNDNYGFWKTATNTITDTVDFVAVHTYVEQDTLYAAGLWDWQQLGTAPAGRATAMMDAAIAATKAQYNSVRSHLDLVGLSHLPIVVGETGWHAVNTGNAGGNLPFRASPANQKMFIDRLRAWEATDRSGAGPRTIFVFEAFDEPWKLDDNFWGMFTVDRKARCAIQALRPNNSAAGGATWVYDTSSSCEVASALYFQTLSVGTAVSANRFTIFADVATASEAVQPSGDWAAFGKQNGGVTADRPLTQTTFAPGDAANSLEITPTPADYGWGILRFGPTNNLSAFAGGSITAWIKTTGYPGKLEIGIATDTEDRTGAEAYLQLSPGDYSYCTTGAWCKVTIPVADFVAKNPKLDLRAVTLPFVIADRYAMTGKPLNTTGLPRVYIDAIY
jgi:exo-beta-1,3-glucanase (GH17 family)